MGSLRSTMPSREPLTAQERIDQATLSITNPNVVGSGYIQFPPQRPFEQPIKVQPPTVAHLEMPEEFPEFVRGGHAIRPQAPAGQSRGGRGYREASSSDRLPNDHRLLPSRGGARLPDTWIPSAGSSAPPQPTHRPPPPRRPAPQGPEPSRTHQHAPRPAPQGPEPSRTHQHAPPAPRPAAATAPAAAPRPVQAMPSQMREVSQHLSQLAVGDGASKGGSENGDGAAKKSKSQAKRLRKKLREGSVPGA